MTNQENLLNEVGDITFDPPNRNMAYYSAWLCIQNGMYFLGVGVSMDEAILDLFQRVRRVLWNTVKDGS